MAISGRLLNAGERVVVTTRTHVKALLLPAVWLIVLAAATGFASSFPTGDARPTELVAVWVTALVLALWLVVVPFLRWLSTSYTITDRRLITRTGILTRRGHDIPLARINDVAYEHGLVDRALGCGTIVVSDASQQGQVLLPDIPHVEQVHLQLSDLLFGGRAAGEERRSDDGT